MPCDFFYIPVVTAVGEMGIPLNTGIAPLNTDTPPANTYAG